jgi:threonine dehydrogenase-like Zn-dependent dehydrogenase
MCSRGLFAQCETTQVRSEGKGASLFGYTSLYGSVPGGQAEYLRVPQAHFGPIVVPEGTPDEQFLFLSDILPTAWQAVRYADVPPGGTVAVLGLGPVGQFAVRIAAHLGAGRVYRRGPGPRTARARAAARRRAGQPRRRRRCRRHLDRDGRRRGPDATIDAVGMEAHGGRIVAAAQKLRVLDPADPLSTLDLTTHHLPLADATHGYEMFRAKQDGCIKVVLTHDHREPERASRSRRRGQ